MPHFYDNDESYIQNQIRHEALLKAMPITQAQYDFLAQQIGKEVADGISIAQGGTIPTPPNLPQFVSGASELVQPDFYGEGDVVPNVHVGGLVPLASSTAIVPPLVPFVGSGGTPPPVPIPTASPGIPPGVVIGLDNGIPVLSAAALARFVPGISARLGTFVGRARGFMDDIWDILPEPVQTALRAIGVTEAASLVFDIPGIPGDFPAISDLFGGGGGGDASSTLAASLGVIVVGSWVANGVRFYRLADGRLAVQNKKGRWKVWRPKRPTVLYGSGAADLKTFLRADGILNRQSKKLAKALNRRSPRRSAPKTSPPHGAPSGQTINIDT